MISRIKRSFFFIIAFHIVFAGLNVAYQQKTYALSGGDWQAGRIIDDAIFFNANTMSASDIQRFLEAKVPVCDTYHAAYNSSNLPPYTCLKNYQENITTKENNIGRYNADGTPYQVPGGKSAATIIYNAAVEYGINPQVLVVMLQKEQSLITDTWPLKIQYDRAMGYACPDTAPCNEKYYGFYNQVSTAAWQLKRYTEYPDNYNFKAGVTRYIQYNPSSSCGGSNVFIETAGTAALYNYTPYQPNTAALVNLYGTATCGAYGNRNFWRLFNEWFGSTQIPRVFKTPGSDKAYLLSGSDYYYIPSPSLLSSFGFSNDDMSVVRLSLLANLNYAGNLKNIVRFEDDANIYLIDRGNKLLFTGPTLYAHYGYTMGDEITLDSSMSYLFASRGNLSTVTNTLGRSEVFLIENGVKQHITGTTALTTLGDPIYSTRSRTSLSPEYLNGISNGAPIVAENSLLYDTTNGKYYYWDGSEIKQFGIATAALLGIQPDYSSNMINKLPNGTKTIDKFITDSMGRSYIIDDGLFYRLENNEVFNTIVPSSAFVELSDALFSRIQKPIKDFKHVFRINNGDDVYLLNEGNTRSLIQGRSAADERDINIDEAVSLHSVYGLLFKDTGSPLLPTGTLFRINNSNDIYIINSPTTRLRIPSRSIMTAYGYSFNNVKNYSSKQIAPYTDAGILGLFAHDEYNNIWAINTYAAKHPIPSTLQEITRYNKNPSNVPELSQRILGQLRKSGTLTRALKSHYSDRIYLIENGKKHWIEGMGAFVSAGLTNKDVSIVSQELLDAIPDDVTL